MEFAPVSDVSGGVWVFFGIDEQEREREKISRNGVRPIRPYTYRNIQLSPYI